MCDPAPEGLHADTANRGLSFPQSSLAPPEEASPKPLVDRDGGLWQGLLKRLYYDEVAKAKHRARGVLRSKQPPPQEKTHRAAILH